MRPFLVPIAVLLAAGCGAPGPRTVSAVAGLADYTPEEATILDDTLAPPIFGLPSEIPPASDPRLDDRARRAETIQRVRVSTISEESLGGTHGYSLTVAPDGDPIAGSPLKEPLELRVGPGSPSLSRVGAAGSTLVGRRLLLFMRRYADRGEPVVHWHGEADEPAVRDAVARTRALDELRRPAQTGK